MSAGSSGSALRAGGRGRGRHDRTWRRHLLPRGGRTGRIRPGACSLPRAPPAPLPSPRGMQGHARPAGRPALARVRRRGVCLPASHLGQHLGGPAGRQHDDLPHGVRGGRGALGQPRVSLHGSSGPTHAAMRRVAAEVNPGQALCGDSGRASQGVCRPRLTPRPSCGPPEGARGPPGLCLRVGLACAPSRTRERKGGGSPAACRAASRRAGGP